MYKQLNLKFEKAVRLLAEHLPVCDENSRKFVLFHDMRVGVYLYEQGYSDDVVLAGLLHDAVEWSSLEKEQIEKEFGANVLKLILANTKDDSIKDAQQKTDELIQRCASAGQDALIIKTADILDSFKWYTSQDNKDQLEYCKRNAKAIIKFKPKQFDDVIFDKLEEWT